MVVGEAKPDNMNVRPPRIAGQKSMPINKRLRLHRYPGGMLPTQKTAPGAETGFIPAQIPPLGSNAGVAFDWNPAENRKLKVLCQTQSMC